MMEWCNLCSEIKQIKDRVTRLEEKTSNLNYKTDEMQKENEKLKEEVVLLRADNFEFKQRMDKMEKYNRENDVIITSLPNSSEINARELTQEVARQVGVKICDHHIVADHKLGRGRGGNKVIVKFSDNDTKTEFVKKTKSMRPEIESMPIYVEDHLMPKSVAIQKKENELRNAGLVKFVWTRNGKIFIRMNDNTAVLKIREIKELENINSVVIRNEDSGL